MTCIKKGSLTTCPGCRQLLALGFTLSATLGHDGLDGIELLALGRAQVCRGDYPSHLSLEPLALGIV